MKYQRYVAYHLVPTRCVNAIKLRKGRREFIRVVRGKARINSRLPQSITRLFQLNLMVVTRCVGIQSDRAAVYNAVRCHCIPTRCVNAIKLRKPQRGEIFVAKMFRRFHNPVGVKCWTKTNISPLRGLIVFIFCCYNHFTATRLLSTIWLNLMAVTRRVGTRSVHECYALAIGAGENA